MTRMDQQMEEPSGIFYFLSDHVRLCTTLKEDIGMEREDFSGRTTLFACSHNGDKCVACAEVEAGGLDGGWSRAAQGPFSSGSGRKA